MFIRKNKIDGIPAISCSEIGLIQALGKAGIPVIVGSVEKQNPGLYSKYTTQKFFFERYDNSSFVDQLCEIGKSFSERPVFFSDNDQALLHLSRNRKRLSNYYRFLLPDHEIVKKILDKRLFVHLCKQYELPAPISYEVNSQKELRQVIADVPFPAIIKPAYKQDWWDPDFENIVGTYQKAYQCNTPKELEVLYGKISEISKQAVIQEYIPGNDEQLFSINMFVDSDGELQGYFLAQKRRIYPINVGIGCYVETVRDKNTVESAISVVQKLRLKGLLNLQFKKDARTGEPQLMEIHTRNSLWSYIGCAAGINLPSLYHQSITGSELPEKTEYREGVKYIDLARDIKSFFQYRDAGRLNFSEWLKTYKGDFVLGGMLPKDPKPIIMRGWHAFQRRVLD